MNSIRMRRVAGIATVLTILGVGASISTARGLTNADVRAGMYSDNSGLGIGGGLLTDMGARTNWHFNPNVEAALTDRRDQVAVNADFHYDFRSTSPVSTYLGGGPALLWRNPEGGDSESAGGVNVLGGMVAKRGDIRPFAQLKGVISDRNQVALVGGIRF